VSKPQAGHRNVLIATFESRVEYNWHFASHMLFLLGKIKLKSMRKSPRIVLTCNFLLMRLTV
jgi:hypothetical protein